MSHLALCGGPPLRDKPFPDWPIHGPEEEEALVRVARSGHWNAFGGPEIERLEASVAALQGTTHAIAVTSGTVALRVALLAAGVRAADEVVVPAYTFQATATAVVESNARPVYADIDSDTYTLSARSFEAAITPRTRFVLPVHFAGLPADMAGITTVARRHDITVIEDAAQAHGAVWERKGVGSLGALGCFSFQASKNLNGGEGGAIVTSDNHLAARCRAIINCGRGSESDDSLLTIAGNYRMTEFQAAVLNCQTERLAEQSARREANARLLRAMLADVRGIAPQAVPPYATRHAWHLFPFRYSEAEWGVPRASFVRAMNAEGIPTTEGYTVPLYRLPMFARQAFGPYSGAVGEMDGCAARCPAAEHACAHEGAWIYQKYLLGSEEDTRDIARAFAKLWKGRADLPREAA